ncbi:MAG: hypothetical protein GX601_08685 [Anaerolineales bacterium]|nr:hypothetical protein [Anaerolineales bacterium]
MTDEGELQRVVQPDTGPSLDSAGEELTPEQKKARRVLIIGLVIAGLLLIGLIVLLVFMSIAAYQAAVTGQAPSGGAVVVSLLRDAAIIFVAFETIIIGVLLVILTIQIQSLVTLLREEIQPMLQSANDTFATVRGTTQFLSQNMVSPVMKWSGYVAGVRRVLHEVTGLPKGRHKGSR